jgi:hypothetical protein
MVCGWIFSDSGISTFDIKTEHCEEKRKENGLLKTFVRYPHNERLEIAFIQFHRCNMDASKRLLTLCTMENGKITRYPERLIILDNGVEHYFVEVTCDDGIQYGLQAYGKEAIALYKETMKTLRE